jgi:outer membrane lipoprotein SlyB
MTAAPRVIQAPSETGGTMWRSGQNLAAKMTRDSRGPIVLMKRSASQSGDPLLSDFKFGLFVVTLATLVGCTPDYSPNTYSGNAVQQANKVEPAVVVGFRQVQISANGTIGAVTGGAAGGVLGSQTDATGISSALGTVGGTLVGGLVGTTLEHANGDTTGWEYIVRKPNGDLLSVTQREPTPLALGQKVLVITGNQARIVPDYSAALDPPPAPASDKDKAGAKEPPAPAVADTPTPPPGEP